MEILLRVLGKVGHGAGLALLLMFLAFLVYWVVAHILAVWDAVSTGTWWEGAITVLAVGFWLCLMVGVVKEWWTGRG